MDNGYAGYCRYLDGDDSGLYDVIKEYRDSLVLYLYGISGNITDAEEIMVDTFTKIAIKKPRFNGKSSFKTWLYAIGRNSAIDHIRRESRRGHISVDEIAETVDDREALEISYIKEERNITLYRAMTKLASDYRQVLWLIYFEGMANGEAAAVMKKSTRQIENLLYRAKKSLKHKLEQEGFIYEEL